MVDRPCATGCLATRLTFDCLASRRRLLLLVAGDSFRRKGGVGNRRAVNNKDWGVIFGIKDVNRRKAPLRVLWQHRKQESRSRQQRIKKQDKRQIFHAHHCLLPRVVHASTFHSEMWRRRCSTAATTAGVHPALLLCVFKIGDLERHLERS